MSQLLRLTLLNGVMLICGRLQQPEIDDGRATPFLTDRRIAIIRPRERGRRIVAVRRGDRARVAPILRVLSAFAGTGVGSRQTSRATTQFLRDLPRESDAEPYRREKEAHQGGADSIAPRITLKRSDSLFRIPTDGSLLDRVCTGKESR
jgi:hypothetical protein